MPRDYIPRPDAQFNIYVSHYSEAVHQYWEDHGLNPDDLTEFDKALNDWNLALPAYVAAQAMAESSTQTKKAARATLEAALRPITNIVQAAPATTDADRATIGITIRDRSLTPAAAPATAPLARIDNGQRLTQTIRFNDSATPTRNAKPSGVRGAEIWIAVTPANQPPPLLALAQGSHHGPYHFLSFESDGTAQADFPMTAAGHTAHYALRWVSTRSAKGPWSAITSATIAA